MHFFFFIVLGNDKKLLRDLKEETAEEEAEGQEENKALENNKEMAFGHQTELELATGA